MADININGTTYSNVEKVALQNASSTSSDDEFALFIEDDGSFEELRNQLDEVKDAVDTVVCPNLAGSEGGVFYPVNLPAGSTLTVSTVDPQNYTTNAKLMLYDSTKTIIDEYNIYVDAEGKRTLTIPVSYGEIGYLRWREKPVTDMMVNLGSEKLDYIEYWPHVLTSIDEINNEINDILDISRKEPDIVSSNYGLQQTGYAVYSTSYQALKYEVTEGQKLFIKSKMPESGKANYAFFSSASISQSSIANLVGMPVTTYVTGQITVPAGAKYLIFSVLKTDTTTGIYQSYVDKMMEDISKIKDVLYANGMILP